MTCCKTAFLLCDPVPACLSSLKIVTPVISGSVTLRIVDRFNKVYYIAKTTDSSGIAELFLVDDYPVAGDTADLPKAFFNEFAGIFTIYLTDDKWEASGVEYDAIQIQFADTNFTGDTYTIDPSDLNGEGKSILSQTCFI